MLSWLSLRLTIPIHHKKEISQELWKKTLKLIMKTNRHIPHRSDFPILSYYIPTLEEENPCPSWR